MVSELSHQTLDVAAINSSSSSEFAKDNTRSHSSFFRCRHPLSTTLLTTHLTRHQAIHVRRCCIIVQVHTNIARSVAYSLLAAHCWCYPKACLHQATRVDSVLPRLGLNLLRTLSFGNDHRRRHQLEYKHEIV